MLLSNSNGVFNQYSWAMGDFWNQYFGERHLNIYRYNLMEHIGVESTVENIGNEKDNFRQGSAKCFERMMHPSLYALETFNFWDCQNAMISPCQNRTKLQDYFSLLPSKTTINYESPLSSSSFKEISSKIGLEIFEVPSGISCDSYCQKKNLICENSSFLFMNNCDILKNLFNCQCKSSSNVNSPFIFKRYCFIKNKPNFDCSSKIIKGKRICPCTPINQLNKKEESDRNFH
jgi:hypothetical protein